MPNRKERRAAARNTNKGQATRLPGQIKLSFQSLMERLAHMTQTQIYELILRNYMKLHPENQQRIAAYFTKYPLWGALEPEHGIFDVFKDRARVLRDHYDDFAWLYERLEDEQSKNVLFGILSNWVDMDFITIDRYKERVYPEYFDPNIFPRRGDEVFVDVGAFTGDSAINFIKTYQKFKRIYCYEITPSSYQAMQKNLAGLPNMDLRQKAAGSSRDVLYLSEGADQSANQTLLQGDIAVEVVRIDEDITEPVTFIKMDIEGAELDALRGCEWQIRKHHPKLAICTYHGNEDIFAVPRLIDEIETGYKFYMRHHGGNLVPTEFSLLAVWEEDEQTMKNTSKKINDANADSLFKKAEEYFSEKNYESALPLYHSLKEYCSVSAQALFRIGQISNILGDAEYASECYYKAFEIDPAFNSTILPLEHPLHAHVYAKMDARRFEDCPLCGAPGHPYWSYYIANQPNCSKHFNPVRTWLYCEPCHHLFSAEPTDYPDDEASPLHAMGGKAAPHRFALYSRMLSGLRGYAGGNALLEVGVGEGECIAVARELLFDVTGIDITKSSVDYVNNTFKLDVIHGDFLTHNFDRKFDIIILGDVIEHVRAPRLFIDRVSNLCHSGTVLWISTPNFESTFTIFAGHDDPMRHKPSHCGYFSYVSLNNMLDSFGFDVVNYEISAHYNGAMEITAIKR